MNSGRRSLPAGSALVQLCPQVLNGGFAVHRFAALDLFHTDRDFLPQFHDIRADEFLLRAQHPEALGDDIGGGTVMSILQLLGNELLLLGCECDRHGLNKRQSACAVKRGEGMKSRSQAFAWGWWLVAVCKDFQRPKAAARVATKRKVKD